ncbi:AAA family ATPase [Nesterenkonia sp. PF2B19]|uniref:AAA family ATPase n=1 Tax=unclassified Nesterenkonia TaxID=2629769 RepID=UPI000872C260|nr:AAA family ATPase [Nesterenkonia sp. PF2B19]OSM42426.1 AAA family ATPase [Nesterenkonia sp. PF2B19]
MLTSQDPITWTPRRIAVAGTSGAGKTTLADRLAEMLDCPRVELDSLYHGEGWVPRESFTDDVDSFTAGQRWVIEYGYGEVSPLISARADTLLWLDWPTWFTFQRLVRRTVRRRLTGEELWNGNREGPLSGFFTDQSHIIRWGIRTRKRLRPVIPALEEQFPHLQVVRFRRPREAEEWLTRLR